LKSSPVTARINSRYSARQASFCGIVIRFNDDVHISSGFKTGLFTIPISQDILNTDFSIQVVGILNADFGFFGFMRKNRLFSTLLTLPRNFLRFFLIMVRPLFAVKIFRRGHYRKKR
jgi:hypothetical protein